MTRLMPHRSIMMPTIGTQTAENKVDSPAAPVMVARSHPNSPLTGFRKTPELNKDTGPLPTMSPIVEPTTIHHGLSNKRALVITSPLFSGRRIVAALILRGLRPVSYRVRGNFAHRPP